MSDTSSNKVNIKLGDMIEIIAPNDITIHNIIFLVDYVGYTQITLINLSDDSEEDKILYIDNGNFRNESIESINILERSEITGYARQNDLIIDTWIDVHFDMEIPLIVTGKITNLEEDQIEITTSDKQVIYIDFAYQGIPLDLQIKEINIRDPPTLSPDTTDSDVDEESRSELTEQVDAVDIDIAEDDKLPMDEFKTNIQNLIMQADQIKFGSELDEITESVYLPESQQRFGIEKQVNDLLDELLSTIPNNQRTYTVLNEIHKMISRFKELREEFSIFDEYNNAVQARKVGSEHKPLVDTLDKLNQKLYWILLVSKNKKKIYNLENVSDEDFNDIIPLNTQEVVNNEIDVYNKYLENDTPDSQNKYIYLQREMNNYSKPFLPPSNTNDVLAVKEPNTNLLTVVNNLEEFKSSALDKHMLSQKKFLLQVHITGESILETHKQNTIITTKKKQIIPNEEIYIKSILTLPEPTVRFSRINLPTTDIATRSNLNNNFINYWLLLKKTSIVSPVFVNDVSKPIDIDENTYLSENTEYVPDLSVEENRDYRKFLETIIPKTRVLFNLTKKYITNNLSIYEILKYMEPFMIYQKDITFKQYQDFIGFIKSEINTVKSNFVNNNKSLNNLNAKSSNYKSELLNILYRNDSNIYDEVIEEYNIPNINNLSDGEIYNKFINIDNGKLYNIALCFSVVSLMIPDGVEKLDELNKIVNDEEAKTVKDCNKHIIAKKYIELDELEDDSGVDVYFDKKYDPTYYDIINEYDKELQELEDDTVDNKIEFLSEKLQKTNGFSVQDSLREARSILQKKRLVEDGEYAILEQLTENGTALYYYKRSGKVWLPDENIDSSVFTDDNKTFCNLDTNCVNINNNCEDISDGKSVIEGNNIKKLLHEFDVNFKQNIQQIKKNIENEYKLAVTNIKKLTQINENNRLLNNNKQYNTGLSLEQFERVKSPYEKLRDSILGQSDFVKKQNDITKFVRAFTRPANDGEDEWWLYCNATNVKILPIFINKLASAYIDGDNYMSVMDDICTVQGEKSDDDAYIVDKYSGYNIKAIQFDVSEGYSEDGYKIKSRDVLEAEFNYSLTENGKTKREFESPETEKIFKVSNAIAKYIGVNLETHLDFITRNVVLMREKTMPSKEKYMQTQAKKKKVVPYEKAYNSHLIVITLSYFIISIQTSIPPIKTRKRFPGCIKSFTGYPMAGEEDLSGITYLACITNKIKSSIEPWDAIKKTKVEDIVTKMQTLIKKYIINTQEVKDKIKEKILYNSLNVNEDEIPESLDLRLWNNYLPQLYPTKIKSFEQVSKAFIDDLKTNYKKSSKQQHEKINVLRSKIIYSTIKIQEHIENIISKKKAILTNSSFEPFLENSCCDSDDINTLQYFINANNEIAKLNNDVVQTQNILDDLERLKKANTIIISKDTKLKYPELPSDFSDETIYKAFIHYCRFNSNIPLMNEEIRAICKDKPISFDNKLEIKKQIVKLKDEGYSYTSKSLNQLIDLVNKKNMEPLQSNNVVFNNVSTLESIINYADENNSSILPPIFISKFQALISNYQDGELMEDTKEMEDMKNYLYVANNSMKDEIIKFINDKSLKRPNKKIIECINTITNFTSTGTNVYIDATDETTHKMINYIKLTIRSICKLYPAMIINNVDYKKVFPPKHWKLSKIHKTDFNKMINKYYDPINSYNNDNDIKVILQEIYDSTNIIYELSENTLFNTPYMKNNTMFYSVFDRKMSLLLFQYYFYSILKEHINLLDNNSLLTEIALSKKTNSSETDVIANEDEDLQIEIEIISGEKSSLSEKVASLLNSYANIICSHKNDINYNYDEVMSLVHRAGQKEKDGITDYFKNLTESEREIQNYFKKHKLEKWSKGLQKGLRVYQEDTYDDERKQLEEQAINDFKFGNNDAVTDMVRNIYEVESINDKQETEFIENEEYNLELIAEDDDYGERDGDEEF